MLIKEVVQSYDGKVEYVNENYGQSQLAERYGITKYPVVFVDEVLVAQPKDFSEWGGKNGGKYKPWEDPKSHQRFKNDLTRMINLAMHDKTALAKEGETRDDDQSTAKSLPGFSVKDLQGNQLDSATLGGKVVVVEFWATWCVPCLTTLGYLGELKRKYGDKLTIVAIAVESEEPAVRKLMEAKNLPVNVVMGSEKLIAPFGDLNSVPTLFVFDRQGKTANVFFGAPEDLHQKVSSLIETLVK